MIGVRPSRVGTGYARILLDYVHSNGRQDHPQSTGVSLSTENSANLSLYEHFGYQRLGSAKVSPELETWVFLTGRARAPDCRRRDRGPPLV
jgi:GNAT superfamily N-acetyltransferase